MSAPGWMARAACIGIDPRAFFADGHHARAQVNVARRICQGCPVRRQCADYAVTAGEYYGVWGGMSQRELRKKRRRFTSRAKTSTRTP